MYGVEGTTANRWLDKWSLIVCEDGQAGINWEHSAIDGQTMADGSAVAPFSTALCMAALARRTT